MSTHIRYGLSHDSNLLLGHSSYAKITANIIILIICKVFATSFVIIYTVTFFFSMPIIDQ